MKKFFKAASILAAVSMLFAFASCQQNPEEEPKSGTSAVFKAETKTVDLSIISVTSITEAKVADEKIATVKAEGTKVTVTSVAKGTTAATVKVEGKKDGKDATGEVTFSITVAETGKITTTNPSGELTAKEETGENPGETPTDPENPGEDPVVPPTEPVTFSWHFSDLDLTGVEFTGTDADASDGTVAKVTFTSESGLAYNSDPTGLVLNLTNGASGGSYNKISKTQSAKGEGATAGAIEPSKGDMVYCELQGPFTATMLYGANSKSDKTDRTAQIKIGDQITSGTENNVPVAGASLTATYTGTDTVKVYFGGTNIIRIYDIIIVK